VTNFSVNGKKVSVDVDADLLAVDGKIGHRNSEEIRGVDYEK